VSARTITAVAGALALAAFVGGSGHAAATADAMPCSLRWGPEHPWCIGARARHVAVSLSPDMHAWVTIYSGDGPSGEPLLRATFESGATPLRWESPTVRPGVYYVSTSTYYLRSVIQPIYGLSRVVRVPVAKAKTAIPAR
jgi:hypothetical protein